jgi:hypothetical protein
MKSFKLTCIGRKFKLLLFMRVLCISVVNFSAVYRCGDEYDHGVNEWLPRGEMTGGNRSLLYETHL